MPVTIFFGMITHIKKWYNYIIVAIVKTNYKYYDLHDESVAFR